MKSSRKPTNVLKPLVMDSLNLELSELYSYPKFIKKYIELAEIYFELGNDEAWSKIDLFKEFLIDLLHVNSKTLFEFYKLFFRFDI